MVDNVVGFVLGFIYPKTRQFSLDREGRHGCHHEHQIRLLLLLADEGERWEPASVSPRRALCYDASHRISKKRPNRPGSLELVLRFDFRCLQGETSGGSRWRHGGEIGLRSLLQCDDADYSHKPETPELSQE